MPLIEAVCEPFIPQRGRAPKSPSAVLRALAVRLGAFSTSTRVWIDLGHLLTVFSASDVAELHRELSLRLPETIAHITPVVRTSLPPIALDAAHAWARARGCGICIRVEGTTHLSRQAETIQAILADSPLGPAEIDLIFDAQDLPLAVSHEALRDWFPLSQNARSWVVLAGTFPKSITHLRPEEYEHRLDRGEWIAWRDQVELTGTWRRPQYGDFATQPAIYRVSQPFAGSPTVRYTIDQHFVVLRGRGGSGTRGADFNQFIGHAIYLQQQPYYRDVVNTIGDRYVERIASREYRTGNLATWRSASLGRHLQVVAAQVARYAPVLNPTR